MERRKHLGEFLTKEEDRSCFNCGIANGLRLRVIELDIKWICDTCLVVLGHDH